MQTVKVSKKVFNEIRNAEDTWQSIWENRYEFPDGEPRLAGGLDHIVTSDAAIEVHDIGVSKNNVVFDNSFKIIPA